MKKICLCIKDGKLVLIKVNLEVAGGYSIPNTVSYVIKELTQSTELLALLSDSQFFPVTNVVLKSVSVVELLSIAVASHELYVRKLLKQELEKEVEPFASQRVINLFNFLRTITALSKIKISVGAFGNTAPEIISLLFNVSLKRTNPVLLGMSGVIFVGGYLSQLDLFASNYTYAQLNRAALILLETALVAGASATSYLYFPQGYEYIPPLYAGLLTFFVEAAHLSFSRDQQLLVERIFKAVFCRNRIPEPDYERLMGIYQSPEKTPAVVARAIFSATTYAFCNLMLLWGNGYKTTKFSYEIISFWMRGHTNISPWFYVFNSPILVVFPAVLLVGETVSYYKHALRARRLPADNTSFSLESLFAIGTTQYRTLTSSWFAISILLTTLNESYNLVSSGVTTGAVIAGIGLAFASIGTRPNFAVLAEYLKKLPFVACLPQFLADSLATMVAAAACYLVSPEVVPEVTVLCFNVLFTLNTVFYFLTGESTVTNLARLALTVAQKLRDGCCPRDLNSIDLEEGEENTVELLEMEDNSTATNGITYKGNPNRSMFLTAANDTNVDTTVESRNRYCC